MTGSSRVHATAPDAELRNLLRGAQFVDAYSVVVPGRVEARPVAERMFGHAPAWVAALLRIRDFVMARFGVKTTQQAHTSDAIGIFPVVSQTPMRLVAGFDDRHLDFRVVVDAVPVEGGTRVTASTVVLTHNLLGRAYLATIMPFHRLIARSMVAHAGKRSARSTAATP